MKVGETFIITNHPPYSMFGHFLLQTHSRQTTERNVEHERA